MSESYKAVLKVWHTETGESAASRGESGNGRWNPNGPKIGETVTTQPLDVEFTAGSLPELLYKIHGHAALLRKPEDVPEPQAAKEAPKRGQG